MAVSVDALMHQWARQESAPAGSALVAEAEISARLRGGALWRTSEALAAAVLARPAELDPSGVDLAWLAASLGAARALDIAAGGEHRCEWPDAVLAGSGAEVAVSAVSVLGPGRVDYAILIARLGPAGAFASSVDEAGLAEGLADSNEPRRHGAFGPPVDEAGLAEGLADSNEPRRHGAFASPVDDAVLAEGPADSNEPRRHGAFASPVDEAGLVGELRAAARLLDEPDELVDAYRRRCATVGCTAAVALLPHGAVRGTVRGIGADGRLEVESPTGLVERIAVSSFSSLLRLED